MPRDSVALEESESNYVPDTDQEDIEFVTESQFVKFMKKHRS